MPTPKWARAVIALFAGAIFLIATVTGESIDKNGLRWLSMATTGIVLLLMAYDKWIWRWPFVRKLAGWAGRPVIHGTWRGKVDFERDADDQPGSETFYLAVTQTFSTVCIRAFVAKSESYSMAATIERPVPNHRQLVYVYRSLAPHNERDTNRPNDGATAFNIVGIPVEEIAGSYFTDRRRRGTVSLTEHTKKIAESFNQAERQTYVPTQPVNTSKRKWFGKK